MDHAEALRRFQPKCRYFIGIDSDGCAFDTMEIKHKECFIPQTIRWFGLQAVSRFAREAAEFVNLYSRWRGINRFPALLRTLDLLAEREDVKARSVNVPTLPATRDWVACELKPANPALEAAVQAARGAAAAELKAVLAWSKAVNAAIAEMVERVPPFPLVRESLQLARGQADMLVVSATPVEALQREWAEHHLAGFVSLIAGQEMGTKAEHLAIATRAGYEPGHVLMIGDAPGDLEAARINGALFYPIEPGREATSWKRFHDEALPRFLAGDYRGAYEDKLVAAFESLLPDTPPWMIR